MIMMNKKCKIFQKRRASPNEKFCLNDNQNRKEGSNLLININTLLLLIYRLVLPFYYDDFPILLQRFAHKLKEELALVNGNPWFKNEKACGAKKYARPKHGSYYSFFVNFMCSSGLLKVIILFNLLNFNMLLYLAVGCLCAQVVCCWWWWD